MASLRKERNKFYYARIRDIAGVTREVCTGVLQEPADPAHRNRNRRAAEAIAELMEDRVRGQISETEYSGRVEQELVRVADVPALTVAEFLVRWAWQRSIDSLIHWNRSRTIAKLFDLLLQHVGEPLAGGALSGITPDHLNSFIHQRRVDGYATLTVKSDIMILKSMASDLGIVTGVNIAEELEYEQESVETRAPFTRQEVQTLLAHLKQAGAECWEWETYLLVLLYTGVRPTDGARLRFADLDLAQGNVRFKPSKTERFTPGEFHIIALHRQLWKQLKSLFSTRPHTATDFICPDLANRQQSSLSKEFRKHCEAAGIDMRRENANHRRGTFTRKTLYSFRHTFNTWLEAAGVSADERRRELGHRNPGSLPSYGHDEDPGVLAARRKLINQLPDFTRGKESLN